MRVESHERATGICECQSTRVLVNIGAGLAWVRVSNIPGAQHHEYYPGVHSYSVDVPASTWVANFYRSESGKEDVFVAGGPAFESFEEADLWAAEQDAKTRSINRWLLNSAVIAAGGYGEYRYSPATKEDLAAFLASRPYESRIGYAETADRIESWTGIRPPLSRELSEMAPGDVAMIVRLRYRVADPQTKGQPVADEAWEIAKLERLS